MIYSNPSSHLYIIYNILYDILYVFRIIKAIH